MKVVSFPMAVVSTSFNSMNKFSPLICLLSILLTTCAESVFIPLAEKEPPVQKQCSSGERRRCYAGPSSTRGIGICKSGYQICNERGGWGTCKGQQKPKLESCVDQVDNNCNGFVNEGCCERWSRFKILPSPRQVNQVTFGPGGGILVAAASGFVIWNITKDFSFPLKSHHNGLSLFIPGGEVSFTADGKLLLLWRNIKNHEEMYLWNWKEEKVVKTVRLQKYVTAGVSALSPTGTKIVLSNDYDTLILDVNTGKVQYKFPGSRANTDIEFSPDESLLALSSFYENDSAVPALQTVLVWSLFSKKLLYSLSGYTNTVKSIAFHPGGRHLVGMSSSEIKLWGLRPKKLLYTIQVQAQQENLLHLGMNKTGTTMATTSGGAEGKVKLWDVATGRHLQTIETPIKGSINSVSFHPDGTLLAFVHNNMKEIRIWRCDK